MLPMMIMHAVNRLSFAIGRLVNLRISFLSSFCKVLHHSFFRSVCLFFVALKLCERGLVEPLSDAILEPAVNKLASPHVARNSGSTGWVISVFLRVQLLTAASRTTSRIFLDSSALAWSFACAVTSELKSPT